MQIDPKDETVQSEAANSENDFGARANAESNTTEKVTPEVQKLIADLAQAKIKISQLEDHSLRHKAELENVRKAAYKEADKRIGIAVKDNITKFLSVIEVLKHGIQAAEKATDLESIISGMKMIETMFDSSLKELDVFEIPCEIGAVFDPAVHQVISKVESKDYASNAIIAVAAKGYTYQGFLLRPANVIVSA